MENNIVLDIFLPDISHFLKICGGRHIYQNMFCIPVMKALILKQSSMDSVLDLVF